MFRTLLKLFLHLLLFSGMLYCLIMHELVIYGLEQGKGQLELVMGSRAVTEVMNDPSVGDSVKTKLTLIKEIRDFAFEKLGILPNENYTSFFQQPEQPELLTVSACKPFSFEAKEWCFPVLGCVSYKGFFNQVKAKHEILQLRAENYDVDVYSPSGWSTLGWFKDPILSGMLKRNEGQLANLIIHELTHGTLYVKNDVTFNENLASFAGDKGAEAFLLNRYGKGSKELEEYNHERSDDSLFTAYMLSSKSRLDSLYRSFGPSMPIKESVRRKKEMIFSIVLGVNRLKLHDAKRYFRFSKQAFREGNAFFMGFDRYESQNGKLESIFRDEFHSDLQLFMQGMKARYPSL